MDHVGTIESTEGSGVFGFRLLPGTWAADKPIQCPITLETFFHALTDESKKAWITAGGEMPSFD